MKKLVLFVAVFAILLAGCSQNQNEKEVMEDDTNNIVPATEESSDTTTNTDTIASPEVEDFQNTIQEIQSERMEKDKIREDEEQAEDEQIEKDMDLLGSFNGEPTPSDCERINHPDVKLACEDLLEE